MIYPYVGDFLISPIPLQLSFNFCSHKCSYCFANLNNPNRTFDLKEFQAQLRSIGNRSDLQSFLLKNRYPVLVSNLVDPFAGSNYGIAAPVLEQLTNMGIPVSIQTRGGKGIDDVLSFLPKSVWYISIPMVDESVRRQIEPAAPSILSRLDLIRQLIDKGHSVVVGVNPTVQDWLKEDFTMLLDECQMLGVTGIWIAALHFSPRQVKVMPAADRARLGEVVLSKGLKNGRGLQQSCYDYIDQVAGYAKSIGLEVEGLHDGSVNNFFEPYQEIYKSSFGSVHDFINWCHANKKADEQVYYSEFEQVLGDRFPKGEFNLSPYLMCMNQQLTKEYYYKMSYKKLLNICWNDMRMKRNMERFWTLAVSVTYDGKDMHYRQDSDGNVIYHFNADTFDEDFFIVN